MLQPDVILPAQYYSSPRKSSPEHSLMMAVVDDAVRCIENNRLSTDAQSRRVFREAKEWLLAEEPRWPYSFEQICAVLDLDANAVRQRLGLAPDEPPGTVSREEQVRTRRMAANRQGTEDNDADDGFGMVAENRA